MLHVLVCLFVCFHGLLIEATQTINSGEWTDLVGQDNFTLMLGMAGRLESVRTVDVNACKWHF